MHVQGVALERGSGAPNGMLTRQNGSRRRRMRGRSLCDSSDGFGREIDDVVRVEQPLGRTARSEHGYADTIVDGHSSRGKERMGNSLGV